MSVKEILKELRSAQDSLDRLRGLLTVELVKGAPVPGQVTEVKDTRPHVNEIMPFGKYRGEFLGDIPVDYLDYMVKQDDFLEKPIGEMILEFLQHTPESEEYSNAKQN